MQEKKPTFNQIEKTSKATGIPLGYFFLQTPPTEDLSLVDYRAVDSVALENPSRNLIDVLHDMEFVQEWTRNHLISEGASTIPFVGAFKQQANILAFADSVRQVLICIGENSLFNDRYSTERKVKKAETVCNAVAAEIIVPQALFLKEWNAVIDNMDAEQAIDPWLIAAAAVHDYTIITFETFNKGLNARNPSKEAKMFFLPPFRL